VSCFISESIYTSEKSGSDENGDGTEAKPFKTVLQAMRSHGKEPFPSIYVDSKEDGKKYDLVAKTQLKKIQKIYLREGVKAAEKGKREEEDAGKRTKNLEEAKKVTISENTDLPRAQKIKISQGVENRDKRVKVSGWVHRLRRQGVLRVKCPDVLVNQPGFQVINKQQQFVC